MHIAEKLSTKTNMDTAPIPFSALGPIHHPIWRYCRAIAGRKLVEWGLTIEIPMMK